MNDALQSIPHVMSLGLVSCWEVCLDSEPCEFDAVLQISEVPCAEVKFCAQPA